MDYNSTNYRALIHLSMRPVFLLTNLVGIICLAASAVIITGPWGGALAAVGSAFLTIGLSLPIALFYQLRANAESLDLVDSCNKANIKAIYESRQDDSKGLETAIDAASEKSNTISLMGVAFHSLLDPNSRHSRIVRKKLNDPKVYLRILVLDPECEAAKLRANIELGSPTIEDIKHTLNHGIPALIEERLKAAPEDKGIQVEDGSKDNDANANSRIQSAVRHCNCEIRVSNLQPSAFLMIFEDSMFTEQYHLGRPTNHNARACIGKYVPVIEYGAKSQAARFLTAHYELVWGMASDRTEAIVRKTLNL